MDATNILTKVGLALSIIALYAAMYFHGRIDEAKDWKDKYEELRKRFQEMQQQAQPDAPQVSPLHVTIIDDGGAHLTVESTVVPPQKEQK